MTESQKLAYFDAPAEDEGPMDPAFKAWLDSKPQRHPIEEYQGGDVLLGFGHDLDSRAYGTRKDDGSWVHFLDGEEIRLDEEWSETLQDPSDDSLPPVTITHPARVPTHFWEIPFEAAIHFMML